MRKRIKMRNGYRTENGQGDENPPDLLKKRIPASKKEPHLETPFCRTSLVHQQPHPRKLSPPQKRSSRMIIKQQLLLSHPHPLLFPKEPFPQILKRIRIHRMEQQFPFPKIERLLPQSLSHLLSHPHPQFVAVKSLIKKPP